MMIQQTLFYRRAKRILAVLLFMAATFPTAAQASATSIAVAANFMAPAKQIVADFELKTGNMVVLSFGSSGQFVAQIMQGAPYEVLLSADAARPQKLVASQRGVAGTCFTYAIGKLVLWSPEPGLVDAKGEILKSGKFAHIAIANPKAAPYGEAGVETLNALGVYDTLAPKIVTGESITQTYQFIASGNAALGFVALSQVIQAQKGSEWVVPQTFYRPIRQDAVLLKAGEDDPVAKAFLVYLKTPEALAVIHSYGYDTVPQ
jgi:molybdate transport system substrate-binding protein